MEKIFISHCSNDAELLKDTKTIFGKGKSKLYYTSEYETGISVGDKLKEALDKNIKDCTLFVPIITDNYLRSEYCLYEMSIALFLNKKIFPIAPNPRLYNSLELLQKKDIIYACADDKDFLKKIKIEFGDNASDEVYKKFQESLLSQTASRKYIGMDSDQYESIDKYFKDNGLVAIGNKPINQARINKKIGEIKNITLLSTTGLGFVRIFLGTIFVDTLARGGNVRIVIPNRYSNFCLDVAKIEDYDNYKNRFEGLAQETNMVFDFMAEAYKRAKAKSNNVGKIEIYNCYTMLRQTIVILEDDYKKYGWVSLTMPPRRMADTPTIEFEKYNNIEKDILCDIVEDHVSHIIDVSKKNNDVIVIDDEYCKLSKEERKYGFRLEEVEAKKYWDDKFKKATDNMKDVLLAKTKNKILIECSAQHPLNADGTPGIEYQKRLDYTIGLYNELKKQNEDVYIFVPGSKHKYKDKVDLLSLSKSGELYLIEHGIDKEHIYGEDAINKYKDEDGVYNSADECYVASKIFFEDKFKKLLCVCSPNQLMRKTVFYIEFGVLPECYSVPLEDMFHNALDEYFKGLHNAIYSDHNWQDKKSEAFINSRLDRKP